MLGPVVDGVETVELAVLVPAVELLEGVVVFDPESGTFPGLGAPGVPALEVDDDAEPLEPDVDEEPELPELDVDDVTVEFQPWGGEGVPPPRSRGAHAGEPTTEPVKMRFTQFLSEKM